MASVNDHESKINKLQDEKVQRYYFNLNHGSFIRTVIPLINIDNTNNSLTSYFVGDIRAFRNNGLFSAFSASVSISKKYNAEGIFYYWLNYGYPPETFKPCTFIYNGKKYGGFEFKLSSAEAHVMEISGLFAGTFIPFSIPFYDDENKTVINAEVKNSIEYTSAIESGTPLYNGKKIWKQGDAITGAVWNDYAEKFEKPVDLQTEPGDIISLDNNGNEEIYKLAIEGDTNIVGVHSDEYGMLLGGTENEEYDKQHYIPVGMLGRVKTKIIGSINKGERIVPSNIPGIGRAYKDGDSLFSIVGYATETNLNTDIKKVRIKINTY